MKKLLTLIVGLSLIFSVCMDRSQAQTWDFLTPSSTNNCIVAPGPYSEGWFQSLYPLGGNGFWDMGQQGTLVVFAQAVPNILQVITVEATTYLDIGIFPPPVVKVLDYTFLASSRTYHPTDYLGNWQTFSSTWNALPTNSLVPVIITMDDPRKGLLIDKVTVSVQLLQPRIVSTGTLSVTNEIQQSESKQSENKVKKIKKNTKEKGKKSLR